MTFHSIRKRKHDDELFLEFNSLISVEFFASWPLLGGGGEEVNSTSFMRTFSNATTAILVKSSSILSPVWGGRKKKDEQSVALNSEAMLKK